MDEPEFIFVGYLVQEPYVSGWWKRDGKRLHGNELRFTPEEIKEGKPRELALQLPAPYNFALEKALRRHVPYRTETAMELRRDLNSPEPAQPQPVQAQPEQLELEPPPQAHE
jgi:hypothetical protein